MVDFSSILKSDKSKTAGLAKERLQIILALERPEGNTGVPDYLAELQNELVTVVSRYVNVRASDIRVHIERQNTLEILEVKVELPEQRKPR